jgi:hypothetical protein
MLQTCFTLLRAARLSEEEGTARFAPLALNRLVGAGRVRSIDRERVTFIVQVLINPPARDDDPRPKEAA